MEESDVKQATFEGWAVVEMMGHRKEIGFVTTQAFGQAVLFRIDSPELPEREYTLESPGYAKQNGAGERWCPVGTKVRREASPARSCLVAPASLYAINPCTEQAAMALIERNMSRPLIALGLPEQAALPPAEPYDDDEDDDYDGDDEGLTDGESF
jgi:hypothetical protein